MYGVCWANMKDRSAICTQMQDKVFPLKLVLKYVRSS